MPDVYDQTTRSRVMRSVKSHDTKPELRVRRTLHALGYRFRIHRRDLPGTPDIVLPRHRVVIFVHGCFWHQHPGCRRADRPSSHTDYWQRKLDGNVMRDETTRNALEADDWRVVILWECEIDASPDLASLITARLTTIHGEDRDSPSPSTRRSRPRASRT